ncbi:FG-GAP-like repeat-containing protein [Streptomyces caeruleatus]|uniref:SGNH hydrolase-type esterase domain-containing protein n=1 Tax=Streptomyces caeruleatus TaxID=661399 RepID=A0A117RHV2_9ACTN|nr:FG-GAP-like repeat-containing protein [Streptomyces caeruleatus]KUN91618.1 hypothetical protein AQJ67_41680 [Streptomyces caeruleatus]
MTGLLDRAAKARGRLLAVLVSVAIIAASCLAIVAAPTSVSAADDGEFPKKFASWNMNGKENGDCGKKEDRWRPCIAPEFPDTAAEGIDVIALQEAGNTQPESAEFTGRILGDGGVYEYRWNVGTTSRPRNVYIYFSSTGQQRNGLAFAVRSPDPASETGPVRDAAQLAVNWSTGGDRPMLGIQIGEHWYFTAHAQSNGGNANDHREIIRMAGRHIELSSPNSDYMVLADFNYDPARLPDALQRHIIRSFQPTHQHGSEPDFAYHSRGNQRNFNVRSRGVNSDHWMVYYSIIIAIGAHIGNGGGAGGCRAPQTLAARAAAAEEDYCLPAVGYRFRVSPQEWRWRDWVLVKAPREDKARLQKKAGTANEHVTLLLGLRGTYRLKVTFEESGRCLTRDGFWDSCDVNNKDQDWGLSGGSLIDPYANEPRALKAITEPGADHPVIGFGQGTYKWDFTDAEIPPTDPEPTEPGPLEEKRIRLMPLGDSITFGLASSDGNGYRDELHDKIKRSAQTVDFVGSVRAGSMSDPDNEGHPGDRIDEIAGFAACSVPRYQPNVVTLHAGTNDMNQDFRLPTAPARLKALVDRTLKDSPRAVVLVAKLIPTGKAGLQPRIDAYNAALTDVVGQLQSEKKHVLLVDMERVLVSDGLENDAHPTDAGYAKMADAWYAGVVQAEAKGWISTPLPEQAPTDCDPDHNPGVEDGDGTGSGVGSGGTALGDGWRRLGVIVPGYGERFGRPVLAELNGDQRADYVQVAADGNFRASINTVGQPGQPDWADVGRYDIKVDGEVRFADIDGDGRDDYLQVSPNGAVRAWRNTGGGQSSTPGKASRLNFELWGVVFAGDGFTSDHLRFADINGDGRDDILRVSDAGAAHVYVNQGGQDSDGKPAADAWKLRLDWAGGTRGSSLQAVRFADADGDGKADYLQVGADGAAVHAFLNRGGGGEGSFEARYNWARESGYPRPYVQFADISGDGKADYLVVYDGGAVRAWLNRGGN